MELLKQKIITEGEVLPGDVLKVDSFLNHQIDLGLVRECAKEWYELFKNEGVTKILTIETAGIALATVAAELFDVPLVYAKKSRSNISRFEYYSTKVFSYTHGQIYDVIVSQKLIKPDDRILIVDDFLANGSAIKVLIRLAELGGAKVVGACVAIEKAYQNGGKNIRDMGYRIESLSKIASMSEKDGIKFVD